MRIKQNAAQTTFGTEKAEMGLAKGLRGDGGGVYVPLLTIYSVQYSMERKSTKRRLNRP